jgi:hypothetical protein
VKIKEKHKSMTLLAIRKQDIQVTSARWFFADGETLLAYNIFYDEDNRLTKEQFIDNNDLFTPILMEFLK